MPIKLILNPTAEEALQFYPRGDHPWTVVKTERHQPMARRHLPPMPHLDVPPIQAPVDGTSADNDGEDRHDRND
jgi:hypothetical protein